MVFRAIAILVAVFLTATSPALLAQSMPGMPEGEGSYEDLVSLYEEFLLWQDEARARRSLPNRDIAGAAAERFPDYGDSAVNQRRQRMAEFQAQLQDMAVVAWPR